MKLPVVTRTCALATTVLSIAAFRVNDASAQECRKLQSGINYPSNFNNASFDTKRRTYAKDFTTPKGVAALTEACQKYYDSVGETGTITAVVTDSEGGGDCYVNGRGPARTIDVVTVPREPECDLIPNGPYADLDDAFPGVIRRPGAPFKKETQKDPMKFFHIQEYGSLQDDMSQDIFGVASELYHSASWFDRDDDPDEYPDPGIPTTLPSAVWESSGGSHHPADRHSRL